MTTEPTEPTEQHGPDGPTGPTGQNDAGGLAGPADATAGRDDADLEARFEAFRTLPTPTPPPVADLRVPATGIATRWRAVAAAIVVVSLLGVATLVATSNRPDELSTTGPASPATSAPGTTRPEPGTSTTARAEEPSTSSSTTAPEPPTTVTTVVPPTTSTRPAAVPETVFAPPASTVPVTPPPLLVEPTSIPSRPPLPGGMSFVAWDVAFKPVLGATTIVVNTHYSVCWDNDVLGARLKTPVVTETVDAVVITFWADPPDQFLTVCPNPPFTASSPTTTVTLAAPLGRRWVYDGGQFAGNGQPFLILDPNFRYE